MCGLEIVPQWVIHLPRRNWIALLACTSLLYMFLARQLFSLKRQPLLGKLQFLLKPFQRKPKQSRPRQWPAGRGEVCHYCLNKQAFIIRPATQIILCRAIMYYTFDSYTIWRVMFKVFEALHGEVSIFGLQKHCVYIISARQVDYVL